MAGLNRRQFLLSAGGSLAALSIPTPLGSLVQAGGLQTETKLERLTATNAFFHLTYSGRQPELNSENWRLLFGGEIETEVGGHAFSLEDIQRLPYVESLRTLECIGNPTGGSLIGTAFWGGVRARDVLAHLQIAPQVSHVLFTAYDGYQTSLPLAQVLHPDTLFATHMNGQPLPPQHGYPLRLLVGGLYAQKMPKWIQRLDFLPADKLGFWESRGWSNTAQVSPHAFFRQPLEGSRLSGTVTLAGMAFGGAAGLTGVDVRFDGGPWSPALLEDAQAPYAWQAWRFTWTPPSLGRFWLEVRARAKDGQTQSEMDAPRQNGVRALHGIQVEVLA